VHGVNKMTEFEVTLFLPLCLHFRKRFMCKCSGIKIGRSHTVPFRAHWRKIRGNIAVVRNVHLSVHLPM